MVSRSAGIVLYRRAAGRLEVLLGHLGGPLWARKDAGAWTIPKGELEPGESPWEAAQREFAEELGRPVPTGTPIDLGEIRQSRKTVHGFALEVAAATSGDPGTFEAGVFEAGVFEAGVFEAGVFEPGTFEPGTFDMEWPPRSGRILTFPELDRIEWFDVDVARTKLVRGQVELLDRLVAISRAR